MNLGLPNFLKPNDTALALRLPRLLALAVSVLSPNALWAQGETTSAVVGAVSDLTGAAIAGAKVTITSADNGLKRSVKTDQAGRFNFPQLKPGPYSVKAEADQFEAQNNDSVLAGLGQKQTVDFTLKIATANQNVTVTEDAPVINPQNPNTSTTLNARAMESLPNPGGDMTYPIQFAAGALMNTAGSGNDFVGGTNGYGNVQFNGLSSLYKGTAGTPLSVLGCPFNSNGSPATGNPPNGDGCANRRTISQSSSDSEQVQTGRVDYNMNENNTAWFRFQHDGGLQAAYTDPINPLFNAISPQPLYSFASGFTHVFSPKLVNYFNPAFSWYESLFGPRDFQKALDAFPLVLQGGGANAPFTTLGGLNDTWVQGRRALRFFINDNLAWSAGAHELRFGTNTRILRLNDYDFGQGTVPTVTYTTLPQY